ncbi:DNA repair protein RecO [Ferrimonas aestuarii]|uniref:DNA repair protein RecO n=1 Tax=Ferrimonas aestuarii TaxID=2569539 RepID=A0A4U1BP66_9GAMM|nr:DNA repair protein RecO [Ferrimonas aestuarii]TKB55312.1 DNA repair protein RecO [Ferrimonas aestuarii]
MATTDRFGQQQLGWQSAYLLHARPYQEQRQLLSLLTENDGVIGAVARTSGKQGGLTKAALQPFRPLRVQLSGRTSLKTLSQLDAPSLPIPLSGKPLFCGLYCNEIAVRLLPERQECPEVFSAYHQSLMQLAQTDEPQLVLRYFEWALLDHLGCAPSLAVDTQGEPLDDTAQYALVPEQGFMPVMHSGYAGQMLLGLRDQALSEMHLSQAKHLSRTLLKPLLGDKPLRSRELFQTKTSIRTSAP